MTTSYLPADVFRADLLRAEMRKVTSTKVWWALLIAPALLALLIGVGGTALAGLPSQEQLTSLGGTLPPIMGVALAVAASVASTFALCVGIIGAAGENRHRTATTTYLTAPGRLPVLAAKLVVHGGVGALYGVVVVAATSLGGGLVGLGGSRGASFPPPGTYLTIALLTVVVLALWAVLGVGLGSLLGNQLAALLGALAGKLIVEGIIGLALTTAGAPTAASYLPSRAAGNFVENLALQQFADGFRGGTSGRNLVDASAGSWWGSGIVFVAWTTAFVVGGWLVVRRRDVN